MRLRFLFIVLTMCILSFAGCEESNTYILDAADSLTDPDIQPEVLFTNPSDGATGPFGITDPTIDRESPRITIQFNKLINISDINRSTISLKSDAGPLLCDKNQSHPPLQISLCGNCILYKRS